MSNEKDKQPLGSDDSLENVNEGSANADDDVNEARVNLRKALEEVQEANEEEEKDGKKDGKSHKKAKKERTPEEEAERALNSVKRKKRLKYGTFATVVTLVFLAIVVVLNVIVNLLDDRFNLNIDLTSSGLYEIDAKTIEYLNQLDKDIQLTVLADESYFFENNQLKVVAETLNRFRSESHDHISIEYVDMNKNPEAVRKYSDKYTGNFSIGDIVVSSGDLVRVLSFTDDVIKTETTINYATYQQEKKSSFIGEQSLVSALMGVTDLNPVKVGLINKMNGSPIYYQYEMYCYQRLSELLDKNNYKVTELDITSDALSDDYQLLILCAPQEDLTQQQIQKLTDYMYNGGKYGKNMIYFSSPNQKKTPKLDEFLETWGIKVGEAVVYEGNDAAAQYVNIALGPLNAVPVLSVSDDELNKSMAASKLPIVAPIGRPLELLFDSNSGRTTNALLTSAATCYLYPLTETTEDFNPDNAEKGSFVLAAVANSYYSEGSDEYKSSMAVFGSGWFLDYYVASNDSYNNAAYFVSLMNTMTGKENVIQIAEKSLDQTTIEITEESAKMIRNITMFIIPLIVGIIGVVVYVRRKNK